MLKNKDDSILTQVGRDTPLGTMMRRYWHPVALSEQVEADGPPLRTRLLGERLVVFRDSEGKAGVLEEMCMHRGVSLALGRNENGGLRCLYHGWKFAVDGTILEMPNHGDCRYAQRMKAPAFPVHEQSGLIWTYLGPAEKQPVFRELAFDKVPDTHRAVFRSNVKANWLPLWEGGLDSSHVGILHTNLLRTNWGAAARGEQSLESDSWDSLVPTYEFADTDFGFHYCAFRPMPDSDQQRHARLVPAIMPYMRIIPGPTDTDLQNYAIEVPMDDFETATYIVAYSRTHPVDRDAWIKMLGYDSEYYDPATCDITFDWSNRLGQDRSKMKTDWTGIKGLEMEDFAMAMSLGPDWDRGKEHLVTSDMAIVRMRRMVLAAIQAVEAGGDPPALQTADLSRIATFDRYIGKEESWQDRAAELAAHTPVQIAEATQQKMWGEKADAARAGGRVNPGLP